MKRGNFKNVYCDNAKLVSSNSKTEFKIRFASRINIILNIRKRTIICQRTSNMGQWNDKRALNNNLSGIVTLCGLFLKEKKRIWFQSIATQLHSARRSMRACVIECQRSPYTVGLKFGPSERHNHTKLCTLQDKILHIPRSEENFFRLQQNLTVIQYDCRTAQYRRRMTGCSTSSVTGVS